MRKKHILSIAITLLMGVGLLVHRVVADQPQEAYVGVPVTDMSRVVERVPISDFIYPTLSTKRKLTSHNNGATIDKHHKENAVKNTTVIYYPMTTEFSPSATGGNMTTHFQKTFSPIINGNIKGLDIPTTLSISTLKEQTASILPNKTARISVAVYYTTESGVNVKTKFNQVVERTNYHVKLPYQLRYVIEYLQ